MKKIILLTCFSAFLALGVSAQKYCAVDTKYILEHMQEYVDSQEELDRNAQEWQGEIETKYGAIERLQRAYDAEAVLLTEEMKKSREEEIERMKQEARMLQQKRFGVEGDLFKKRQELIAPIQQEIFDKIREYATENGYMFVFDKAAGQTNVLYVNLKYDKSDKILRKLGLRPGEKVGGDKSKDEGSKDGGSSSETKSNTNNSANGGGKTMDRRK
ncbi:MAG: OmpH family outer membrane protein [Bacteroidota bacterium]